MSVPAVEVATEFSAKRCARLENNERASRLSEPTLRLEEVSSSLNAHIEGEHIPPLAYYPVMPTTRGLCVLVDMNSPCYGIEA